MVEERVIVLLQPERDYIPEEGNLCAQPVAVTYYRSQG